MTTVRGESQCQTAQHSTAQHSTAQHSTALDNPYSKLLQLKSLLPEIFSENQIDFEKFQQLFGDQIATSPDRYGLNWAGKSAAYQTLQSPTFKTLTPCVEESVNFDTTQNLFIEGENLEVLKALQKSYFNSVKMIYIDPPYNTGNDFVYNDNFAQSKAEYAEAVGDLDEQGKLKKAFVKNSKENGHYHSNWLNMMLPRLHLARNLLKDDGVIFISIDDNEQAQLKLLCDEVLGEENFLVSMYIQVRYAGKTLAEKNDYQKLIENVLVYCKTREFVPIKESENYSLDKFCWEIIEKSNGQKMTIGGKQVDVFYPGDYEIKPIPASINGLKETWATGTVLKSNASGKYFGTYLAPRKEIDGLGVMYKVYGIGEDNLGYRYFTGPQKSKATKGKFFSGVPNDRREELLSGESLKYKPIVNFYDFSDSFGNCRHEGGVDYRSGKKPIAFLSTLINQVVAVDSNDIVMDFFAGSGSTAHTIMQLNSNDNGNRKFIIVQLPEILSPDNDEQKDAYNLCKQLGKPTNIAEISKERIRRAGKQISEQNQNKEIDTGFKVFKLTDSHFKQWQQPTKENLADQLEMFVESLKKDAAPQAVLYEILLRLGLKLTAKVRWENGVFWVEEENITVALLLTDLQAVNFDEIFAKRPQKVVALDSLFANNDALKKNTELQMNDAGIAFVVI